MSTERSYKEASGFFNQFFNTCISILKVLIRSDFSSKLPKAESDTCIVLGNGPSLKTSLTKHKDFFTIHPLLCVNNFSTTEEFALLKPKYYVILDYAFWLSEGKIVLDTVAALESKTTWPIQLFIPKIASSSKRFEDLSNKNKNVHINYFNYTVFSGFPSVAHFFYNKNLAMPQSQNVLVASIFLSMNMGFKKTYIVGADHSWHQTLHLEKNNVLCIKDIHFYENEEKVNYRPFKKGTHLKETFKMYEIFTAWSKVFYGYIALENYSKYKNCRIYNASAITFIDAFEQVNL